MAPTTTAEPQAVPAVAKPKTTRARSNGKAKATTTRRAKAATPKAATKKAAAPKVKVRKAAADKPGPERNQEALRLLEGGMKYREIAEALGWANPGVAWNAVDRARKERAKAAKAAKAGGA